MRPSPVDRGKPGSEIHVLSDRASLPLTVVISGADTHDSHALKPLVNALSAIRVPTWTPAPETGQAARGQGLRHPALRAWLC